MPSDPRLAGGLAGAVAAAAWLALARMTGLSSLTLLAGGALLALLAGLAGGYLASRAPAAAAVESGSATTLSFTALPAGGLLGTAEAMTRLEEELALAQEYQRPLCVAMFGLDPPAGDEPADLMEGLAHLVAGNLRRHDVVTDRGSGSLLLVLPETTSAAGWVVLERLLARSAPLAQARAVLLVPSGNERLREVLDELDAGLDACRATGLQVADPRRLLAEQP